MSSKSLLGAALSVSLVMVSAALPGPVSAQATKVISDKTATGFAFPESVAYDPTAQVLYVSEFGSELKPTQKDGKGRISKISLDGTIQEETFLPAEGQVLNKPKGIWVAGDRLWVTNIDVLWVFDTTSKEGRKVDLPGIQFANDPTIIGDAVYVSDNRGDQLYRVEPADFLKTREAPKVSAAWTGSTR